MRMVVLGKNRLAPVAAPGYLAEAGVVGRSGDRIVIVGNGDAVGVADGIDFVEPALAVNGGGLSKRYSIDFQF